MFRRRMRRRAIVGTAVVGGAAYAAGHHSATKSAEQQQTDAQQNAQIEDVQQQQDTQQQAAPPVNQQPLITLCWFDSRQNESGPHHYRSRLSSVTKQEGEPEQPGKTGPMGQRGAEGGHRYPIRQKLVSFCDDYWIANALGSRVFFVDSKAFRLREHLGFQDMQGNELASIQEKVMHIKDTYSIYRKGNVLATVK